MPFKLHSSTIQRVTSDEFMRLAVKTTMVTAQPCLTATASTKTYPGEYRRSCRNVLPPGRRRLPSTCFYSLALQELATNGDD